MFLVILKKKMCITILGESGDTPNLDLSFFEAISYGSSRYSSSAGFLVCSKAFPFRVGMNKIRSDQILEEVTQHLVFSDPKAFDTMNICAGQRLSQLPAKGAGIFTVIHSCWRVLGITCCPPSAQCDLTPFRSHTHAQLQRHRFTEDVPV
jgi:hypothetical protein